MNDALRSVAFTFCTLLALPATGEEAAASDYQARIREARTGHYAPALHMLKLRLDRNPEDSRTVADYLVIAGWAGDRAAVLRAYEQAGSPATLPAPALDAVARAYRDARQWPMAIRLFSQGERRFPGQAMFAYGHVMTLADAGHPHDAIERGKTLVTRRPGDPDAHLALAYAYGRNAEPYAALAHASQAYSQAPDRPYVVRAYVLAQQDARLPQSALQLATAHPGLLSPSQTRSLQADVAAQLTRAASADARGEADRHVLADRALAQYDRLIPQWRALGPEARDDVRRAEADRLQALRARGRMRELAASYESMRAEGAPVPDYALGDAANAYLALRQPEAAAPLFQRSLASDAASQESAQMADRIGLSYALAESGRHDEAGAGLDKTLAALPTWVRYKGNPVRRPNPAKLDAELARALGTLYQDDTPKAQADLDRMVGEAPGNTSLRVARAEAWRARDLPRQAELDLKIAETQAPRSVEVETGQAETALALQEWHQAQLLRDDLVARVPENPAVRRLDREWTAHEKAEWRTTASRGAATGSPVLGSRDASIDSVLYSPPIGENWRVFAGTGYSEGRFDEGDGHYTWARAGLEWRGRDLTVQAEASGNRYGHGTRAGAAFSAFVDLDDHWQAGAGAALLSRDTPLRALKHDIRANTLNATLRWRGDERREWILTLTPSFFSDGNRRLEAGLSGRQRLYTAPRVRIDALLDLSASRNTSDDAPYFNPRSDLTILPALRMTHTLYQRDEARWEQQFLLAAGAYAQQGHGTGGLYTLGYGQRYHYGRAFEIGFLASDTSRPYDGRRERSFNFLVDMTVRF
ncbi:poly-beta-1,6 N-acetyl-D-glucosamine export porin PgaA [Castellaniella sp. WN]